MDDVKAPTSTLTRRTTPDQAARDHSPEALRWLAENQAALHAWDEWVDRHGLPYPDLRRD